MLSWSIFMQMLAFAKIPARCALNESSKMKQLIYFILKISWSSIIQHSWLCLLNDGWNVSYVMCCRQLPSGLGIFSIEQGWMYILESCSSILEPCWLKKAVPPKDPEHLIHHLIYQPFLRVKLLDSKTWDVFGRHQKRCTSRWCTARAVVCRRTAVQVLWRVGTEC